MEDEGRRTKDKGGVFTTLRHVAHAAPSPPTYISNESEKSARPCRIVCVRFELSLSTRPGRRMCLLACVREQTCKKLEGTLPIHVPYTTTQQTAWQAFQRRAVVSNTAQR